MDPVKIFSNPGQDDEGEMEKLRKDWEKRRREKREKNNAAVKRIRERNKQRAQLMKRLQSAEAENKELKEKIRVLSAELASMKGISSKHIGQL